MDVQLMDIGMKIRNIVMYTSRCGYASVCNHPFLVGLVCFLMCLHRSFPFIFSLLLSASPVLVCTAVLLGTLLSFGEPNIPEIEIEERTTTYEAVLIKTGVLEDAVVVDQVDLLSGAVSEDTVPLISGGERSLEVELNDEEDWGKKGLGDVRTEWDEERHSEGDVVENHYAPIPVVDDERSSSEADSFGSEKVNVDTLDSPPRSPLTRLVNWGEVEGEDADSGSDRAESSSPDASMADIIPMLDELHPLLDQEAPRPRCLSVDESDTLSTKSQESDNEAENHKSLVVVDDDNEGDDDNGHVDKEEGRKSAFTWTEEDQKNLMDLGSSEIERNLRLESLILRRRARKNMNMLPERDLIDLESLDFPFSVAPISTRRHNPFDHSQDCRDNSGLPPIPGSAPSVLLPRRNPFDIPYDSSEEKPNLAGGGFLSSHESFNVRPSLFGQDGNIVKIRPYFVPEQTISEESSYFQFERQSSEISESKVSSVLETESVVSAEDMRDRKFLEDDNSRKVEAVDPTKEGCEEDTSGNPKQILQKEECTEEYVHRERELISIDESLSEHIRHGSESLQEERSLGLGQAEKAEFEDNELEVQLHYLEDHHRHTEVESTEYHPNSGDVRQIYTSSSSSSSLSEEAERVFTEMESEGLSMFEERSDLVAEEPVESSELSITSASVNNIPYGEPVYDYSPLELETHGSSSLIHSGVLPESDPGFPPVLVKRTEPFIEMESEQAKNSEIDTNIPRSVEVVPESSSSSSVADPLDESRPADIVDLRDSDSVSADLSGVDDEGSPDAPEPISSESSNKASTEETLPDQKIDLDEGRSNGGDESPDQEASKAALTLEESEVCVSVSVKGDNTYTMPDVEIQSREDVEPVSEEIMLGDAEVSYQGHVELEDIDLALKKHNMGELSTSSSRSHDNIHSFDEFSEYYKLDRQPTETNDIIENVEPPSEDHPNMFHSIRIEESVESVVIEADGNCEAKESLISSARILCYGIQEPFSKHPNQVQVFEGDRTVSESNIAEIQELDGNVSSYAESPLSPDFSSLRSNAFEVADLQTTVEGVDEIKDIDEGLLSELDNVGDFSINRWESGSSELEKHEESAGGSLALPQPLETEDALLPSMDEHVDLSTMELSESKSNGSHDSPDQEASKAALTLEESEVCVSVSVKDDNTYAMPDMEIRSGEDVEPVSEEIMLGNADTSYQGHVELEASTIEDIDLALKKISNEEIGKPVLQPPVDGELQVVKTGEKVGSTLELDNAETIVSEGPTSPEKLDEKQLKIKEDKVGFSPA